MAENKYLKMDEVKASMEKEIANIAAFVKSGETEKAIASETALKGFEKRYVELRTKEVFKELTEKETPIIEAIKMHSFKVPTHKVETDDKGVMTGIKTGEKLRQIDLLAFCKYAEVDIEWESWANKLNQLICLRVAIELGYTKEDIEKLSKTYWLDKKAQSIELGKTPTSNNQLCKMLQTVIDHIVFVPKVIQDEITDENCYKCNNHDVAYLLDIYANRGKALVSVSVAKHDFFRKILMDVLHRIICNKKYSVEGFKKNKESK